LQKSLFSLFFFIILALYQLFINCGVVYHCTLYMYRRLWLFSVPRQLGTYYYTSAYIITVTRPGLLCACALNRKRECFD